jgi:hypothetical protein
MIPADYTPLARKAYEGSSQCFRPWEQLTKTQQGNWIAALVHLATPPQARRSLLQTLIEDAKRERAMSEAA